MKRTLRRFIRPVAQFYLRLRTPRFYDLRQRAHGMLNPLIYERIYQKVYRLADLDIVEIGGASGASSVAIALAMKESAKQSHLIVVEKLVGGTRDRYGGYTENLKRIQSAFDTFAVRDQIHLFPQFLTFENGSEVQSLVQTGQIAAFMHDADGRLDRDFFLFWPMLQPGGLIIIDDYQAVGNPKQMLTYRLLNQLIAWKLFQPTSQIRNTVFGQKPADGDIRQLDLQICQRIIADTEANTVLVKGTP